LLIWEAMEETGEEKIDERYRGERR